MEVFLGDCFNYIAELEENSIDCVITDPPYFLDCLDENWNMRKSNSHIKSLPMGMKFSKEQGKSFEHFINKLSKELYRVLKPGGFLLSFSSPRLYHNMVTGIENSGFEIRDQIIWYYKLSQVKASRQDHIIEKDKKMTNVEKFILKEKIKNYRIPMLKANHESICVAMKPIEGRFIDNFSKWGTGMINVKEKVMTNVLNYEKPSRKERENNNHPTVKPLNLMEELICTFCPEGGIVLDPFLGSGTTMLASWKQSRFCKGSEKNADYVEIIKKRMKEQNVSFI